MIDSGIARIESVSRLKLASEAAPVVEDPRSRRNRSRSKSNEPKGPKVKEEEVIKRYPLVVTVAGDMDAIHNVLNNVAATKEIFYSIRYPRLENARKLGLKKGSSPRVTSTWRLAMGPRCPSSWEMKKSSLRCTSMPSASSPEKRRKLPRKRPPKQSGNKIATVTTTKHLPRI